MYQQQQLQSHQQHLSSKPEKPFFLQGGGDSGLILSTDAKPRLKWTPELHERFVEAVNQLGGPEKATPKTIMRLMGIPGLTLYHLKSHLQKYRLSKNVPGQANASHHAKNGCRTATDKVCEGNNGSPASHFTSEPQINRSVHISEALQMQIEVQRRLQEQLEVQRHVQLRIEAQGKYLQSVLQKAQEALTKHRSISVHEYEEGDDDDVFLGLAPSSKAEATQQQQQVPDLASAKRLRRQHDDGSVDSCVTAWEAGSHNINMHSSQSQSQRGEEGRVSEDYMLFLEEPTRGGDGHRCDTTRILDDDDLTAINSNNSTCRRRPRADCDSRIDLNNGSTWN